MMQFQMFLQQLIPAMEFGTALMTPLAVLLAILYSCDGGNLRKTFRKAAYWGFWGSVFIMAAKQGTRNAVSREGFEGLMAFFRHYQRTYSGRCASRFIRKIHEAAWHF